MSRLKVLFLVLFLVPINPKLAAAQNATPVAAVPTDKKQDFSHEPYIVESEDDTYRFENDGRSIHTHHARYHVQSIAGVEQLGILVYGYSDWNEKLEVKGAVEKKNGTKVPITDDNIQDLTAEVARFAPVYSDFHEKHVTVPGLAVGDTLDVATTTTSTTPLIPGQFWGEQRFNRSAVVLSQTVTIDVPAERKLKIKWDPAFQPKITEADKRKVYAWSTSHLEPQVVDEDEDYNSDAAKARRRAERKRREGPADIQLTTFETWEELGDWFLKLEHDRMVVTPDIQAKAAALTKDLKTDKEKARALYDFVSPSVRYVSVSFGIGRYQPHDPTAVMRNEYGDCKDKHTLYATLLKAAGIDSAPVLINSERKIDPDVPSPAQFNHVFTALPSFGADVFADTTPEVSPYGLILPQLRDKQALLVTSNPPPHLITTPADGVVPQYQDFSVDGAVNGLGRFHGVVSGTVKGTQEVLFRTIFRKVPSDRWKPTMSYILLRARIGGEAKEVEPSDVNALEQPFTLKITFDRPNLLDWTKHDSTLDPLLGGMMLPEADTDSDEPLPTGGAGEVWEHTRIELPAGYKATAPIPVHLKRDFMAYESKYAVQGQVITAERHLQIFVPSIKPEQFHDWEAFRRAVEADERQEFGITHDTSNEAAIPDTMKADELFDSGRSAYQERNYKLAIKLLNRVVQLEPKHKNAWGDLGLAYLADRQPAEAVKAFQQQIQMNSYDEYAYNNLGRAYWMQHDYAGAETAFRKQIEINPLDKWAHANLGNMLLGEKKYAPAVPELEANVQLNPKDAFAQVSLGDAYLNTGQTDKAMESFERAANLSPTPPTWNQIAYTLSLKKVQLDRAEKYATDAINALESSLRNTTLESLQDADLFNMEALANTWDTLGWIYFQKGDLARAEKYIAPVWNIEQHGEVGDHLGQIYAQQGKKADAIRMYKLSLHTMPRSDDAKEHLASLTDAKTAEHELTITSNELVQSRTKTLKAQLGKAGAVDFFLLLAPDGRVEAVKQLSGGDEYKPVADELKQMQFDAAPDSNTYHLVRRGTVTCTAAACSFALYTPDRVTSTN